MSKARVMVAMSGGVDSSVSAALLQQAGHEVVGAMMRFWPDSKRSATFETCCSPDAAYEARRVADHVGIPFYLLDYRDDFEQHIVTPFLDEYRAGRTPNPCVLCNSKVKFASLVHKARMLGCDYVATGHYVRRVDVGTSDQHTSVEFHRGDDPRKDQTYFLWGTPRDALERVLFPVGHLNKPQVRELARQFGLITAEKPESQDICFVPNTIGEYLGERIAPKPGQIVDATGAVVGEHDGVQFYTIGQKKGLKLYHSHNERFVIGLDAAKNQVVVGSRDDCHSSTVTAIGVNYLVDALPQQLSVQVRYRSQPVEASVVSYDAAHIQLRFTAPQFAVTPGQSLVLYSGSRLLGGGFIADKNQLNDIAIKPNDSGYAAAIG
jgi:tRNA-uridine 2-sulfurtransferase